MQNVNKNMRPIRETLSDRDWNPPGIKPTQATHKKNMRRSEELGLDLDGAHRIHGRLDIGKKHTERN